MALLSSRSDGRDCAKGALEPNVAGDQWSEKQNTGRGGRNQTQKFEANLLVHVGLSLGTTFPADFSPAFGINWLFV